MFVIREVNYTVNRKNIKMFWYVFYKTWTVVKRKTFTFLCDEFTWDNIRQILSESVGFCKDMTENILVCFFRFTV